MGSVRVELLSWLADTLETGRASQNTFEEDLGDCRTVRDLLSRYARMHPEFQRLVFDVRTLSLSPRVAIFRNGRQIELEGGIETTLSDGDRLVLVPVLAGG